MQALSNRSSLVSRLGDKPGNEATNRGWCKLRVCSSYTDANVGYSEIGNCMWKGTQSLTNKPLNYQLCSPSDPEVIQGAVFTETDQVNNVIFLAWSQAFRLNGRLQSYSVTRNSIIVHQTVTTNATLLHEPLGIRKSVTDTRTHTFQLFLSPYSAGVCDHCYHNCCHGNCSSFYRNLQTTVRTG